MWRVLILAVRWNVLDDARYATMLVEHTRPILHHINPFCTMYSTIPPNTREGSLANNRSHRRRRKNSTEKSEEATTLPPPTQFQSRTEFERPKSSSSWSRCRSNIISSFQPIQHPTHEWSNCNKILWTNKIGTSRKKINYITRISKYQLNTNHDQSIKIWF